MDLFLAFLAGLFGGLVAVGIVALVLYRKLSKDPSFQMMKSMGSMGPRTMMRMTTSTTGFKKYGA